MSEPRIVEVKPGYGVSDDGRIWSRVGSHGLRPGKPWRQLRPTPSTSGHLRGQLGPKNWFDVATLVLTTFGPPRPKGYGVKHRDGDKRNNAIENLHWARQYEANRGENNKTAVLNENEVREIMRLRITTGYGAVLIARRLGYGDEASGRVGAVLGGRNWRHITGLPKPEKKIRGTAQAQKP